MFQFPRFPSLAGYLSMTSSGLPHSEISGSTPACGSPKLIAAFYVLHRLLAPRHPPYALSNLTYVSAIKLPRYENSLGVLVREHLDLSIYYSIQFSKCIAVTDPLRLTSLCVVANPQRNYHYASGSLLRTPCHARV
jgi:hypothetical protein